jgi:hypothetical protein
MIQHRDPLTTVPMYITCISQHNTVDLYLPRTFTGPIAHISTYGSLQLSTAVQANSTIFYEMDGTKCGFIGDYDSTDWGSDPSEWKGDELYVESVHRPCRVWYIDEASPSVFGGRSAGSSGEGKGLFSKWFGT